jgi:hypothetical protein
MRVPKFITTLLLAALILALFAGSALAYDLTKVKNPSFEKDTNGDGIPNAWSNAGGLTAKDKRVCSQSYGGACSFKMVGNNTSKYLYQATLYSSGPAGVEETLSAYVKGKNIVNGDAWARVWLEFNQTDGGSDWFSFQLPTGNSGWTYRQVSGTATETFSSISVWLDMRADSGKMWVDLVDVDWTDGP